MPVPLDLIKGRVTRLPPLPDVVEVEERYEVEEVINSQFYYRKLQFLVKWKGYGHKENLWLSERDINAPDLIADFYVANPKCSETDQHNYLRTDRVLTLGWKARLDSGGVIHIRILRLKRGVM